MDHIAVAVQRGNADIMLRHTARLRGLAWPTRRKARSSRRCSPPTGCGRGRSGRCGAKASTTRSVAGNRAAALAARLLTLPSPSLSSAVVACSAAQCFEGEAGSDVDSDAGTVCVASPSAQMQVDTEVEVSSPPSSLQFVPESPLGAMCAADVNGEPAEVDAACAIADVDGEAAEVDAACEIAELPGAGHGKEAQHSLAAPGVHIVNAVNTVPCLGFSGGVGQLSVQAVTGVTIVNTAVSGAVNGKGVDRAVHNVNMMRECEGRDDVVAMRDVVVGAEGGGEDAGDDGEVQGARVVRACELGQVLSDWASGGGVGDNP